MDSASFTERTDMMIKWIVSVTFAGAMGLAGATSPTFAQAPAAAALPTGDAVIAKYVEATGGVAAYDAIRNRVVHARMEILGANVVLGLTVYSARPNSTYTLVESEVTGRIESGVSDDVVWESSAMRGAVVKTGAERDDGMRDAIFDRMAHWKDHLKSAECTGTADVNGKPAYRVVATPKAGSAQTLHFDKESGLVVRTESTVNTAAGPVTVVAEPGDFRRVDGILMAFSSRMDVMGQQRVVRVEKVEHNVDLPADRFTPPAEIKALIKK
jgi:outer membrane lipoprotein-sorting protein